MHLVTRAQFYAFDDCANYAPFDSRSAFIQPRRLEPMHLALVDNVRIPPSPKMVGVCPVCDDPVLAKCGTMRVHHSAHRGTLACDAWRERELQWHRDFKNQFPIAWQEGIPHVADAKDTGPEHHRDP